jgi:cytoskeletal protein RodZ
MSYSPATLAVLLGIISWGGLLHAQQTPADSQPQTQQPPTQPSPDAQPPSRQSPDQPSQQTPDQSTPSQSAPSQGAGQGSQAEPTDQAGGQTFTGTVMKQGDKYVLQDAATGTTYDIDHQDEVKKFEGKKVRVHGTLDASGKMIHVQ